MVTPRRLDPDVVRNKLAELTRTLDELASVGAVTTARLQGEAVVRAAVERFVTRLVDLAVDVNAHVVVAILGRAPGDYRSSFSLAAEAGIIDPDLAGRLAPSVGMRNVVVHEYDRLDLGRLAAAVPAAIADYREYVRQVASSVAGRAAHG
jgi:uncharacterized protein YutE (UPF0331/DUF86 family)